MKLMLIFLLFRDNEKVAPALLHKDPQATEETGYTNIPGIETREQTIEGTIEMTIIVDHPAHHFGADEQAIAIAIA
jgi:hypothetical protein